MWKTLRCNLTGSRIDRLYITSSYKRFNFHLRKYTQPHPFKMTVYQLDEGLRVLRAVAASIDEEKFSAKHLLYRGMANCVLDEKALKTVGGVERAPMSTTNNKRVAFEYARLSSDNASHKSLIEFVTEALSTSVSIGFLSVDPREVRRS